MAIQVWIADGVERGAEHLRDEHAMDTDVEILETHCCALADFGGEELRPGEDDVMAGVLVSFRGALSGVSLLVMEPVEALQWSRSAGPVEEPVRTYVELARTLQVGVIESAREALAMEAEVGAVRLEESSLAGCLLRTHAPMDTVLISSRLRILAGRQYYDASLHLLVEPKLMVAMLGALSVSAH